MHSFWKRCLKYLLILSFLSVIIIKLYCNSNLSYFEIEPDYSESEEFLPEENTEKLSKAYNFSFDGFNPHYIRNLKKTFDYEIKQGDEYFKQKQLNNVPLILWWTPFTQDVGHFKKCGGKKKNCFFTNIRKYKDRNETKGLLFYGTDFSLHDLPLPRKDYHEWGLLHEESPKNNYLFSFELILKLFNHTSTFKRQSDQPLVTQYLTSIDDLENRTYLVSTEDKNRYQKEEGLAPIAYIQSDCITPSDRDIYVKALMKHIKVDSYGRCLHNKDLPENLRVSVMSMSSEEFYRIIAKYKFVIAFENAVCEDYVTEKLWRSFYIGSVPLVYGSSKSKEIFPDEHSAIEILNYKNAKELSDYLNFLNQNDTEYEKYLQFKKKGGVKNKELIQLVSERKWGINNDRVRGNFIDSFECMVCERIHENEERKLRGKEVILRQVNKNHYGCPMPYTFSSEGVLLDETYREKPQWRENSFMTSFGLAYVQQKLFFEKYYTQNNMSELLSYKSLENETKYYYFNKFLRNNEKLDL